MDTNGWLHNWIVEATTRHQKAAANKVLAVAKQQEASVLPPDGYEYKWVDGPLRSKKRILIKIESNEQTENPSGSEPHGKLP